MLAAVGCDAPNDGKRARAEQRAQIAIARFRDVAELLSTAARILFRNQADPCGEIAPRSKHLRISDAGDQRRGKCGADARNGIEPSANFIASMPADKAAIEDADLLTQRVELNGERKQARAHQIGDAAIVAVFDHGNQLVDALAPDRCDDAELSEVGAYRVAHGGELPDKQMAGAMQDEAGLLIRRLDRHEAHAGPLHGLADCLGVGGIVLLSSCLAPPNRGHLISNHFFGACAPGEEPFHSINNGPTGPASERPLS